MDMIKTEQISGWAFITGVSFEARSHDNMFWGIRGILDEKFPIDEFLFDPITFTFSHLGDFVGKFNGTVGSGEISLKWKSGGTMRGESSVGDYEVTGQSTIW